MSNAAEPSSPGVADSELANVTKAEERRVFVILAVFLAPILSVMLVGGYGFVIWMSHLLLGPPAQ
ncbi:MAG: periplasmic nitrate reductase, NapE protein [Rhizobiaceae bacterium]